MGFPLVPCGRSCLKRLDVGLFGFSLFGIVASIALADWIWRLKVQIADHLDLALPGEGQLWPDILGLAVIFVAPVHALELALRASIRNDFAYGIYARRRRTDNGKMLERLLFLHAVLSCLSGLLVMGACAGGSFFWSYSRRRMRQGLNRAMSRYNDDGTTKIRVDKLQLELRCCGDDSYLDWIFFSRRSDDAHYYDEDNDNEFADGDAELTRGLKKREHREDSGASSGAESIDGTCGNNETRRIDCAKENPRNSRRENYEVDRTKDRRKKANPNNCEDGKSKKATQNKIRGEYRDDLQNALEKSEDKIDRTTKIADNQELGNRRKLQSTEASFSSSTSSSSSLPPLPPTPGNLPNQLTYSPWRKGSHR